MYSGEVDKANEYLTDFSTLMRLILIQSNNNEISIANEIQILDLYIKLEALRFSNDFNYRIKVHEELSDQIETIKIPSMIIQPFVENAIKHGLMPMKGRKELTVEFLLQNELLLIIIADNGIGIEASKTLQKSTLLNISHESMGMNLVRKRLKSFKDEMILDVNSDGETGTVVTIKLKI